MLLHFSYILNHLIHFHYYIITEYFKSLVHNENISYNKFLYSKIENDDDKYYGIFNRKS